MLVINPSCSDKKEIPDKDISISDIPTAEADDDEKTEGEKSAEEFDSRYSDEENEKYTDSDTNSTEYRSEKERVEIANGIYDVQMLIESGDYEDAMMLIKNLKTRKLSEKENKALLELQEQMITITD